MSAGQVSVTVVTAEAVRSDELTDQDYADIYEEVRRKMSLRAFVDLAGSVYSIAWWSKLEAGKATLTRQAKRELRRVVGLPDLRPTVEEAVAGVDPDATVYRVGEGQPDRVVLVGHGAHQVLMRLNGRLDVVADADDGEGGEDGSAAVVTGVTRYCRPRGRIMLERDAWERLNEARTRAGLSWAAFLAPLVGEVRDG